jgi:fibrillarin-like pre-rRNA processing protein
VRAPRRFVADRRSPRLARVQFLDRTELFTETVGDPPPVYGERWAVSGAKAFRSFEPGRSKLSAGLVHDWSGPLPIGGERWLYLGAASGTTASHIADLVGPSGRVYALERSPRPFARLLSLAERWPNILPILGDAREPRSYSGLVPPVDGVYGDIAQPDQVEIIRRNAELFVRREGDAVVLALKTSSMGRERESTGHLAVAERELAPYLQLSPSVRLDPFHKAHYLVGGRVRPQLFVGRGTGTVRLSRAAPPGRPRR